MAETQKSSTAGQKSDPVGKTAAKADPKTTKPATADKSTTADKPVVKAPVAAKPVEAATPAHQSSSAGKPATPAKPAAPKKVNKDEMIQKHQQMVQFVQNLLGDMENDMKRIRLTLNQLAKFDPEDPTSVEHKDAEQTTGTEDLKNYSEENAEVVEGKFDGYFLV